MAADVFCKIEGIDGESTDDKHVNWIELLSFTHGISQPVSGASRTGGRTGGRADFQDFMITKEVDKSTPDLNLYCCNGTHIPTVEIAFCLAAGEKHTFLKYTLTDVVISSVTPSGSSGDPKPLELVGFAYGKIKWEYTPIDQAGNTAPSVDRTWNLEENKPG